MRRAFHTLDVFTETPLAGNPLAVVLDSQGLDDTRMQSIAREFNLAETVFVSEPKNPVNTAAVRIFTPARELPFAGHPTVGTAVLLAHLRAPELLKSEDLRIVLEEKVGDVVCVARHRAGQAKAAYFTVPRTPERMGEPPSEASLAADLGLEVEDIGFELPEIDFRIQSLDASEDADLADEFPPVSGPPVSRPGDLWILGDHRLLCGSALEASAYDVLLCGAKAAAIFTDPPYNVKIDGHVCGSGAIKHPEFAMASGEMTSEEFERFLCEAYKLIGAHAEPGAVVFACMDWRHMWEMLAAARAACFDPINLCVWVKSNGGMGSLYRSRHELVFVFRNGKAQHLNNVQLGRFGRNRTNVWNYAGANSFPRKGRAKGLDLHPTVKPIAMVADALLDSTKPDDLVLDPFCGSGATILAAERVGRRAYGIEIDPLYVDTTITRWERMIGAQAHHASGGTFSDIKAERRMAP